MVKHPRGGWVALLAMAAPLGAATAIPVTDPNILFILTDDQGYGDLSIQGAPDLQSPKIDNLMSQGIRFTQFYANSNVCSPSRASILTGRPPDYVGVPGVIRDDVGTMANNGYFNSGAVTLPQALKNGGYHTAIVGKWHLGLDPASLPNQRGFDYFHGFLGDMMDSYTTHLRNGVNYMRENGTVVNPAGHATDVFTQWAIDYLHTRVGKPEPFFLYLAYNAPHTPLQPKAAWLTKVLQREPGIDSTRAKLVALIEHMDDGIGKVLDTLQALNLSSNTLVVFVSDNGGELNSKARNAPLRGGKGDMWEGGIRVPMGMRWPGHIAAGGVSGRVAITMDFLPTLCDAAGVEVNHEVEGRSFLPALLGNAQPEENRYLIWVRREGASPGQYYASRKGSDKILKNSQTAAWLRYNLQSDPGEQNNLGPSGAIFNDLDAALVRHLQDTVWWDSGTPAYVPRSVKLSAPAGGETWVAGTQHNITWSTVGAIPNVSLSYAFDNGSWITVNDSLPNSASGGTTQWRLPAGVSGALSLRVMGLNGDVRDVLDRPVTVNNSTAIGPQTENRRHGKTGRRVTPDGKNIGPRLPNAKTPRNFLRID